MEHGYVGVCINEFMGCKCQIWVYPVHVCRQACTYCQDTFTQILRKYEQNEDFEHNKDQFAKDGAGVQVAPGVILGVLLECM